MKTHWFAPFLFAAYCSVQPAYTDPPSAKAHEDFKTAITKALKEFAKKPDNRDPVDLTQVIETTLKTHPDGKIAAIDAKKAREVVKIEQGGYYPQLSLFTLIEEDRNVYPYDNRFGFGDVGLMLSMNIWSWGATREEVHAARLHYLASLQSLAGTQVGLGLQAANIYLLLLRERINRNFASTQVLLLQDFLKLLRDDKDPVNPEDLSHVEANLLDAQNTYDAADQLVLSLQVDFERIVGVNPEQSWLIRPDLIEYPADFTQAIQVAFKNNPLFIGAGRNAEAAAHHVSSVWRNNYLPRVDLYANGDERTTSGLGYGLGIAPSGTDHEIYSAGVKASILLWGGPTRKATVNIARLDQESAQQQIEKISRFLQADIHKLYLSLDHRPQRIIQASEAKDKHYDSYQRRLDALGPNPPTSSDIRDIVNDLQTLFQSSVALNNEAWSYLGDIYGLHAQTGELLKVLGVKITKTP